MSSFSDRNPACSRPGSVPVSPLLPWLYPMADRYLYTIMPSFVGAGLVAAQYPHEIRARQLRAECEAARAGGSRDGAPTP